MNVFKSEEGKQAITAYYENILDRWPVEHTRYFIDTGLGRTHVIDSGSKDKEILLLLHGSASNSATWMGDVERFSRHFRTIALDLPGEPGLSEEKRLPFAGNEIAEWLHAIVRYLKAKQVRLIGMSLGGWYGLKFAVTYPEIVHRLTLIAPGGLAPQRSGFLLKVIFYSLFGEKGKTKINRLVYHKAEVPREVYEFGSLVSGHFNPVMETLPIFSDEELKALQFPIQFFGGTRDSLMHSIKAAKRLAQLLPHARVNLLKDTGHVIIDQGEKILEFQRTG